MDTPNKVQGKSGTKVPPQEGALVTTDGTTNLELWLSKDTMEQDEAPPVMAYLIACAMRFHHDPTFVQEQLDWLDAQCKALPGEIQH